jgi:hypothetical protein
MALYNGNKKAYSDTGMRVSAGPGLFIAALLAVILFSFSVHALGWTSPTGWNNPGGDWRNGAYAYDENLSPPYFAEQTAVSGWGNPIELTLSTPIYCDKVRVDCDFVPSDGTDQIQIRIYNGSWTTVYTGTIGNATFDPTSEISFTGISNVTAMSFAWHWSNPQYIWWLYEVDFWSGQAHTLPSVQTSDATSVTGTTANLHGQITDDGYTSCQHRFEYGTTTSYGSNTSWGGSSSAGQTFGNTVTGLTNGITYHFRAQAKNDVGTVSGGDKTFSTGSVTSGWISPSSHSDPGGTWNDHAYAYDDENASCAWSYHAMYAEQWSNPLVLVPPASITSNSIRFLAGGGGYVDFINVEVYDGSTWTSVYNNTINDMVMTTANFAQQTVTQARISMHVNTTGCGLNWAFYDFDFYKICVGAPTLDWTGEANYTTGGVNPLTGYPWTNFTFRVKYTDACNAGPSVIQVWVDKNGDGNYADAGEKVNLSVASDASATLKDGDYTNGEVFSTTMNLDYGASSSNISYKFVANNGTSDATGSPTTALNYPDVLPPPQRTPQWSKSSIGTVNGGSITESALYVGTNKSTQELISVNLSNGNTNWTFDASSYGACKSPTWYYSYAAGKYRVLAAAGNYVVGRQDEGASSSQLFAPVNLGATAGNPYPSPDDTTFYVTYANTLTRRKLSDGSVCSGWPVTVTNVNVACDPSVFNNEIYVGTTDGKVQKIDKDGTPLATFNGMGGASVNLPLLVIKSALYVTPDNSNLYAVNTSTMLAKWASPASIAASNTGASFFETYSDNPYIYVAAGSNVQKIYDNGSAGIVKWTYNAGGTVQSGPIFYPNVVYFGRNGGRYYALQDYDVGASLLPYWPYIQATGDATTGPWADQTNGRVIFGTTGGDLQSFAKE